MATIDLIRKEEEEKNGFAIAPSISSPTSTQPQIQETQTTTPSTVSPDTTTVGSIAAQVLPGVKAIDESIEQGSLDPAKKYFLSLVPDITKLVTEKDGQLVPNNDEIRKAIEARYPGVQVKEVRTMIVRGKRRSQFTKRGKVDGRTSAYKKALVTLRPDSEQIDFFEEV